MSTPTSRAPSWLLTASLALALAGVALLMQPGTPGTAPVKPPADNPTLSRSSPPASLQTTLPSPHVPKTTTPAAPGPGEVSALPPHGDGAAGDQAIQQALEAAWPADLPPKDEAQLRAAGRELLRADATGIGRSQWPAVFGAPGRAIAPAFATVGFRVQAVIARRDGATHRAVVHLVWAGTDRGGTHTDGRISDLHFTRTIKKGQPTWAPRPRT
ncbi:hypothetical protein [Streptomyces dubilierae]|uniref:Secreted protein n=1 Tax=Streptomyces dubilierae TaxID=3075533 RepID=A0ABU2PKS7_9ACTN|nr:hypothetical protein [Streptomyces sp. DSM 41921]MDT0392328.1 hypothetical protein [Streptomyces sp. DSM 41921]